MCGSELQCVVDLDALVAALPVPMHREVGLAVAAAQAGVPMDEGDTAADDALLSMLESVRLESQAAAEMCLRQLDPYVALKSDLIERALHGPSTQIIL